MFFILILIAVISIFIYGYIPYRALILLERKYNNKDACIQPINMVTNDPQLMNTDEECQNWRREYRNKFDEIFREADVDSSDNFRAMLVSLYRRFNIPVPF